MNSTFKISGIAAALMLAASPAAMAQATGGAKVETGSPSAGAAGSTPGGADSAAGTAAGYMDQAEIEDRLEDRGFSDIDIELSDDRYTGKADWYDEEVDLEVSASSGRVEEPTRLTEDQVKNKLEEEGYENVEGVREAGDEYTLAAERFGESMDLRVNAESGNVLDPRELKRDQIQKKLEDEEDYSDLVIFERDGDYGNYWAVGDKDDSSYLLEVNPVSGEIVDEREES